MSALFSTRAISGIYERTFAQRRRTATVVVACLVLGLVYYVVCGQTAYYDKHKEQRQYAAQIQSLQQENEQRQGHVDRLQNDPRTIEHEARVILHRARPGEVISTLPPTPAKDNSKH
ncbi:MAG: septum formation initiator family protein [Acidobacteriaceae bacterium]|nr:septum formation initiator family protein [Acidobacteriaceae bacterium]